MSDNYNSGSTAKNPHEIAEQLARWTRKYLVNRLDTYGYYKNGKVGCSRYPLTTKKLTRHYLLEQTIGLYACDYDSTGKWLCIDIDAHDCSCPQNLSLALRVYQVCKELELECILEHSDGGDGYHIWIVFADYIPAEQLRSIGLWLQDRAEIKGHEVFPKQSKIKEGGVGNFVRLPGQHHKKPHVSRIWSGKEWTSLEHLLTFTANDIAGLPSEALTFWKAPENSVSEYHPVANYDYAIPYEDFLPEHDWTKLKTHASGEVEWARPGVEHVSATTNWKNTGMMKIFTSNAGVLKEGGFYTKAHVYELLHNGELIPEPRLALDQSMADSICQESLPDEMFKKKETTTARPFQFCTLTSAEFAAATYTVEWLVKGMLVKGQPGIVGGPKKVLKTSILVDFVLSLGSGTPFLDRFNVKKCRVALISGESGDWTIQETAKRICKAKGINLADTDVIWGFKLPQLAYKDQLAALKEELIARQIEVVIIDPIYLCLLTGQHNKQASNLFDMGPLLLEASRACLEANSTPLLVAHAKKFASRDNDVLDLEDLAFSGIQEFARQWLLISRRKEYEPGSGLHRLWMTNGGSCGQSSWWGLDIDEGRLNEDFTGRIWAPVVMSVEETVLADSKRKKEKKEKKVTEEQTELMEALRSSTSPTRTELRKKLGWYAEKFDRVVLELDGVGLRQREGKQTRKNGGSYDVTFIEELKEG